MKLQDYIHYYIGCRCFNTWFPEGHPEYNRGWILRTYRTAPDTVNPYGIETEDQEYITSTDSIKPILRLVEDMADEDIKSFIGFDRLTSMYTDVSYKRHNKMCITVYYTIDTDGAGDGVQAWDIHFSRLDSLQFHHLLKAGFDMFYLIKNGLAIDSKTLK